jgi:HEPN domain-containing protein
MSAILSQQWLGKASEDLVVARLVLQAEHIAHACFLSQRCIEKALKAYLIATVTEYPRTHGLVTLLNLCLPLEPAFKQFQDECAVVDQYYVPTRYPDGIPGGLPGGLPGEAEAKEAITAAENILQFVTTHFP